MGPMVAINGGTKDPWPKPGPLPLGERVLENTFGSQGHSQVRSRDGPPNFSRTRGIDPRVLFVAVGE